MAKKDYTKKEEEMASTKSKNAVKIVSPVSTSLLKGGGKREKKETEMTDDEIVDTILKAEEEQSGGKDNEKSYAEKQDIKKRLIILGVSVAITSIFVIIGLAGFVFDLGIAKIDPLSNYILALMILTGPISFVESARLKRIKKLEARLADFLRDLAESTHAGLTLAKAIKVAASGEYGLLTPEIRKMAIQISWGVPATESLEMFADRVNTPLVRRAVVLINEANAAGGDVSTVLAAAATDTKEMQLLQNERSMEMTMYVATIFVAFVVFLVVILIVYATFVPQMKELQKALAEAAKNNAGTSGGGGGGALQAFDMSHTDFNAIKRVYVLSGLVQGFGDGLVAGLMQTGKILNGLKYAFIMVAIVYAVYIFAMA